MDPTTISLATAVLDLNVYECPFHLEGSAVEALSMLKNEFRFSLSETPVSNGITVDFLDEAPPYQDLPTSVATTYGPAMPKPFTPLFIAS